MIEARTHFMVGSLSTESGKCNSFNLDGIFGNDSGLHGLAYHLRDEHPRAKAVAFAYFDPLETVVSGVGFGPFQKSDSKKLKLPNRSGISTAETRKARAETARLIGRNCRLPRKLLTKGKQ